MKTDFLARSVGAALLIAGGLILDARAADDAPDNYAVMSSIGDALTVVTYNPTVGSNLDSNDKQVVALNDHAFDRQAAGAASAAIRRSLPGVRLHAIVPADGVFDGTDEDLTSDGTRAALLGSIKGQLTNDPHYLVVIAKHRGEARLRMAHGAVGSGKLSGLGFYIDRVMRVADSRNGYRGTGFMAPYAYLSATLIDVRTGAIVRTESVEETMTVATAQSPTATDPWDVMTPEQKIRRINVLVKRAMDEMMPKLVAPA